MTMQVKRTDPASKMPFNYIVLLDIVVVACILVVAGRPDGLAITVTAIIVAVCAVLYRGYLGLRASMTRPPAPAPDVDRKFKPTTFRPEEPGRPAVAAKSTKSTSWLRESD